MLTLCRGWLELLLVVVDAHVLVGWRVGKTSPLSILWSILTLKATILMCALLGLSFYCFRRSQYELFLLIHIGLSVLVLLTMLGYALPFPKFG